MSLDQAYQQGLADYEAALVAQTQQSGASAEAYYQQGMIDYELALLEQAAAAEAAQGSSTEAAYMQGMADYEAAMLEQHHAAALSAAGNSPEEQEAYVLGQMHYEAELTASALAQSAQQLAPEHKTAYERGRADYEAALMQATGQTAVEPGGTQAGDQAIAPVRRSRRRAKRE